MGTYLCPMDGYNKPWYYIYLTVLRGPHALGYVSLGTLIPGIQGHCDRGGTITLGIGRQFLISR